MRKLAKVAGVLLCVILALSVTGCGHKKVSAKKGSSGAADMSVQGDVTVYTSLPAADSTKYLADFKKQYPNVTLTVVNGTPWEIVAKVMKEQKAPVADVIWHTPLSAVYAADEASPSPLAVYVYHPGQYDAVQADYTDPDHADMPLVTGTDARLIAWAVNPGKTGGATPQTFNDLIDPKYAGQIVAPSINTDAGYTMVSLLLSTDGEDAGWTYLDSLDKNVTYYSDDENAPPQAVADGSAGVGIGWDKQVTDAANSGGSAQAVFPGQPEMSPFVVDADALVKKPSPSNAAKTFLEWAISDNAMNAYAAQTPITSVDEGAGFPQGYPGSISDQLMQNPDWSYMADNHAKIVAEWTKRYGKKIKAQ